MEIQIIIYNFIYKNVVKYFTIILKIKGRTLFYDIITKKFLKDQY